MSSVEEIVVVAEEREDKIAGYVEERLQSVGRKQNAACEVATAYVIQPPPPTPPKIIMYQRILFEYDSMLFF